MPTNPAVWPLGEQFADHRSSPQSGILVPGTKVPPAMPHPQVLGSLLLSSHVSFTPLQFSPQGCPPKPSWVKNAPLWAVS